MGVQMVKWETLTGEESEDWSIKMGRSRKVEYGQSSRTNQAKLFEQTQQSWSAKRGSILSIDRREWISEAGFLLADSH
jgi:hypothetical protein